MISAFGVTHTVISKKEGRVDQSLVPIFPSTTVMAYNNSQYKKKEAAARNLAAKLSGSAIGFGAGYLAYKHGAGNLVRGATKLKYRALDAKKLKSGKIATKRSSAKISEDKKKGYAASTLTSLGAGVGGYIGGRESLQNIKSTPRYRYKER